MIYNFTQLAEEMHISSVAVKKKIEKYQTELEEYLVRNENNKIIGFNTDGLDKLRSVGKIRRSFKADKQEIEITKLKIEIESLRKQIKDTERLFSILEKELDDKRDSIIKLQAEITALKGRIRPFGWIGFKK